MDVYLRIDINLFASVLLGIIMVIAFKRLDKKDQLNKIFLICGIIVIFELLCEAFACVLNRSLESWANSVSTLLHVFLFGAAPILTYFWYWMISHWIISSEKLKRKRNLVLLFPVAVNLIISLLSPFYGLVFHIDDSNVYNRGPLFLLSMAIVYFYFIYSFVLIYRERDTIVREEYVPLLLFGILPLIGGYIQTMFYGVLLMWSCVGFSMVIVFILLQQRMSHIDDLTGAWTRGAFEYNIEKRIRQNKKDVFGVIFLDVDGLKKINDEFGHAEGDYALKTAVQLIMGVLKNTDIIARTGGDEFLIILDCESRGKMEYTIEKIKGVLGRHNEMTNRGYWLDCSIGAELYDSNYRDYNQFIRHVDHLMYENKKIKKCS